MITCDMVSSSPEMSDNAAADGFVASFCSVMDDLGLAADDVKASSLFSGQEELFAFARCVSRLVQMGTKEWTASAHTAHMP